MNDKKKLQVAWKEFKNELTKFEKGVDRGDKIEELEELGLNLGFAQVKLDIIIEE